MDLFLRLKGLGVGSCIGFLFHQFLCQGYEGLQPWDCGSCMMYLTSLVQVLMPLTVSYMARWFGILVAEDRQQSISGLVLGLRLVPVCDAATALYTRFFSYLFPVQVVVCAEKDVFDGASALAGLREFLVDAMVAAASCGPIAFVVCYQCPVAVSWVLVDTFGLVAMTPCHEREGSRIAFAQTKATPRVDVAETSKDTMELEKPECRFPMFVRTFSGTRTLYASSSMLVSGFTLLVSQSTAVPETSFYLTFQGTFLLGGHTIGKVGIGRDASSGHEGSSTWWSKQQRDFVSAVPSMVLREVLTRWVLGHQVLVLQVWALASGVGGCNRWVSPAHR